MSAPRRPASRCLQAALGAAAILAFVARPAGGSDPVPFSAAGVDAVSRMGQSLDAIVYTDLARDAMLEKLAPLVDGLATAEDFRRVAQGRLYFQLGTEAGVVTYTFPNSGVCFTYDADGRLVLLRRQERVVNDRLFPELLLPRGAAPATAYSRAHAD